MTLFLTSSPCIIGAPRAILTASNGFLDRLRAALPPRPRTLFICADPDNASGTDEFAEAFAHAFREAGLELGDYTTLDHRNMADTPALVAQSQLIILSGGHVPTQNAFFEECDLRRHLQDYDGVLMGISAGSMNAAQVVYAQPENPGESIDPDYPLFLPGLGLTDIQILPHYQQVKDYMLDGKRLYEDITYSHSYGHTFHVFPDGTYLYQDDRLCGIFGECYTIRDGVMEQICYRNHWISL